jgi:hypothetical protein
MYEIWEFSDTVSRCIARRTKEEIQDRFHDMKIGEQRQLSEDTYITRIGN